jgi:hypothetical protein
MVELLWRSTFLLHRATPIFFDLLCIERVLQRRCNLLSWNADVMGRNYEPLVLKDFVSGFYIEKYKEL